MKTTRKRCGKMKARKDFDAFILLRCLRVVFIWAHTIFYMSSVFFSAKFPIELRVTIKQKMKQKTKQKRSDHPNTHIQQMRQVSVTNYKFGDSAYATYISAFFLNFQIRYVEIMSKFPFVYFYFWFFIMLEIRTFKHSKRYLDLPSS